MGAGELPRHCSPFSEARARNVSSFLFGSFGLMGRDIRVKDSLEKHCVQPPFSVDGEAEAHRSFGARPNKWR